MNDVKISYKRHLAKTISYRLVSTTIGFVAMWLVTGSLKIGATFSVAELLYKPIQYFIHERIWYKWIKFGILKPKQKKHIEIEKNTETKIPDPQEKIFSEKKVLNYGSNR